MFCTFTSALPAVFVLCPIRLFVLCSSLISCCPSLLRRYFLSDSEMVPVAHTITGITLLSHSTRDEFLLWGLYVFQNLLSFYLDHISVSRTSSIYSHACSLCVNTNYDIRFIDRHGFVSSHLLVPYYRNLNFMTSFNWFWYMVSIIIIIIIIFIFNILILLLYLTVKENPYR